MTADFIKAHFIMCVLFEYVAWIAGQPFGVYVFGLFALAELGGLIILERVR